MSRRRFTFRFIFTALIIIVVLFFLSWWILPISHNLLGGIASPTQRFFSQAAFKVISIRDYWRNYNDLIKSRIESEGRIADLEKKMTDYETIKQENDDLKKELKFIKNNPRIKTIVGSIVSHGLLPENQFLLINKGSKDNIKVGDPVISDANLIGKISLVNDYTAQMSLLSDNNSQVAGRLQNDAKTSGMIKGEHGLGLVLDMIPKNEIVNLNDYVITSGLEDNIPSQLLIGRVSEVRNSPQDVFQKIVITPLINYHKIDVVTVILSGE